MDFFSNLYNKVTGFASNLVGGGGKNLSADISSFTTPNVGYAPPPPVVQPPVPFGNYTPAPNVSLVSGGVGYADPTTGKITSQPGAIPPPQIRPLITSPALPPAGWNPNDPSFNPSFSGSYQSPAQKAQSEAQRQQELQGKVGIGGTSYSSGNGGFQQPAQKGTSGLGGFAGTGAGASLGGAVGGVGTQSLGTSQEEQKNQGKQPNFTMISAQQAQDAARQGILTGAGQSGVFKDQQGNFYGISNAQVANQFGAPGIAPTPTIASPTLQPFQTSLATGPISAEALLKTSGISTDLIKTASDFIPILQQQINDNLASQPPLPAQPVVDNANQAAAIANSNDPYGLSKQFDAERANLGIPAAQSAYLQKQRDIQATEDAFNAIIKDMRDNPDLPKGLAERRITQFTNINAVNLNRMKGELSILQQELDFKNKELDQRFGIDKFNVEKGITTAEQQRDNTRNQISQFVSSGAIANMSDADLQKLATGGGYTLFSLKAIRDAVKTKAADITNVSYKENAAGDVTVIGLDANNKPTTLGTIKGIGTPSKTGTDESFTRLEQLVKQNPATGAVGGRNNVPNGNQWDSVAAKIDKEFGAGTATKYDNYLQSIYGGVTAKGKLTPDQQGIITDAKAAIDAVKQQYGDWNTVRQNIIERSKQQYNFDISPYL